jgi:hypothetical protein
MGLLPQYAATLMLNPAKLDRTDIREVVLSRLWLAQADTRRARRGNNHVSMQQPASSIAYRRP